MNKAKRLGFELVKAGVSTVALGAGFNLLVLVMTNGVACLDDITLDDLLK